MRTFLAVLLLLVGTAAHADTHTVELYDFYYSPRDISITQGDTVRFVWVHAFHDAVAGNPPGLPSLPFQEAFVTPIDTGLPFAVDVVFSRELLVEHPAPNNRYEYYCTPHFSQGMRGSVTVQRTSQSFVARGDRRQVVPPSSASGEMSCTGTLNGEETQFEIRCEHNLVSPGSITLNSGLVGANGEQKCEWDAQSDSLGVCPIASQDDANLLVAGSYYVLLRSEESTEVALRAQVLIDGGNRTISGHVRRPDGAPIAAALVSDGVREALSGADGAFTLEGVPSGVYELFARKTGFDLQARWGVNPTVVNANNPSLRDFVAREGVQCTGNRDNDPVCDEHELEDGSDADDNGSFRERIVSPAYSLWNGFLNLINILSLNNRSDSDLPVRVQLFSLEGVLVHEEVRLLTPKAQIDVIINELPGFRSNSYGIIKLIFADNTADMLDGQMFVFKADGSASQYEFGFAVPLTPPTRGESFVSFNTYQPSLSAADANLLVEQWLSIVNVSEEPARFTVQKLNQSGELLERREELVGPLARVDLEAGHVVPGPNAVGIIQILPEDDSKEYFAQLFRYGPKLSASGGEYQFAFPIFATKGTHRTQYVPISTGGSAENWLELSNPGSASASADVVLTSLQGEELFSERIDLAPFSQRHLNAGEVLGPNASGVAKVRPQQSARIFGQSMFYFRSASGGIESMYGSKLREEFSRSRAGSFNLFLGMFNWLKLVNVSSESTTVSVKLFPPSASVQEFQFTLLPNQGGELGLHEARFGLRSDTFGSIEVLASPQVPVLAEILRVRPNGRGGMDFVAPTPVR